MFDFSKQFAKYEAEHVAPLVLLACFNVTNHTGIDFDESAVYPLAITGRNNRLADMSFFTFLTVKARTIDPRTPKRGLSLKFLPRITQSCSP